MRARARSSRTFATVKGRKTTGLDGRTTCSEGHIANQRTRKRVEEIFGWMKTAGGFRKTRFRGLARFGEQGLMTVAAKRWTMPIRNWKPALNRFMIEFADRMPETM